MSHPWLQQTSYQKWFDGWFSHGGQSCKSQGKRGCSWYNRGKLCAVVCQAKRINILFSSFLMCKFNKAKITLFIWIKQKCHLISSWRTLFLGLNNCYTHAFCWWEWASLDRSTQFRGIFLFRVQYLDTIAISVVCLSWDCATWTIWRM